MNVGFIGGCINFTNGIERDKLYHSLLKQTLSEVEIKTEKYLTYSEAVEKSIRFIDVESIDTLFIFIRHFPYMVLNKPFVKLIGKNKKHIYRLHPGLINRKVKSWPKNLDFNLHEIKTDKVPERKYFGLRDINSILGKLLGLHFWAYKYVESCVIEINDYCIFNNIKLIVVGPTKNPETYMGDKICSYLNLKMMNTAQIYGIDFIDINTYLDEFNNSIFKIDKIHFNEYGHEYLYKKIIKKLNFSTSS